MHEKQIEQKLVKYVTDLGGWALKLSSPGTSGLPDRLLLMPGGIVAFVEVKAPGKKPRALQQVQMRRLKQLGAPGKKPRALQQVQMRRLKQLGFHVLVLDDARQIESILDVVSHAA